MCLPFSEVLAGNPVCTVQVAGSKKLQMKMETLRFFKSGFSAFGLRAVLSSPFKYENQARHQCVCVYNTEVSVLIRILLGGK